MRCPSSFVTFLWLTACSGAVPAGAEQTTSEEDVFTDLGEVVMVNDLETEFPEELRYGHGGGVSMEMMFTEELYPQLRRCMGGVRAVADRWAEAHRLPAVNDERSASRLLLHYRSNAPTGIFEVIYRIHRDLGAVHAYFGFYDDRMRRLEPQLIQRMLDRYHLGRFVGELREAVQCEDGGSL